MKPSTVNNFEKRVSRNERYFESAKSELNAQKRELSFYTVNGKRPPSKLVAAHSSAEAKVDMYEFMYKEAQKEYSYAKKHEGKRIITKEARSKLKSVTIEDDINQGVTAQQQRIELGNKRAKPSDIRLPKGERHYLGSNPDY
ncbi:hypothetical protein PSYAR_23349 [Pseudomonas syringae pv. aceris str. M302273]|nr:hypothetical protein PSYAR_23349 [Pseudomonas syringae pv. aceris str. M302273]